MYIEPQDRTHERSTCLGCVVSSGQPPPPPKHGASPGGGDVQDIPFSRQAGQMKLPTE